MNSSSLPAFQASDLFVKDSVESASAAVSCGYDDAAWADGI
jgi:hypothetical protein